MSAVTEHHEKQVARSLRELVPLIKEDLRQGNEAAQAAAMPYYRSAGEKMIEARSQMSAADFHSWVRKNFKIGKEQSSFYMRLSTATARRENSTAADGEFQSIKDFRRVGLGHDVPTSAGGIRQPTWQQPIKAIVDQAAIAAENLRNAELTRAKERDAERKLALQLIDIGFKALATKLHPDKGGSRDAMQRLNRVRARLREHA